MNTSRSSLFWMVRLIASWALALLVATASAAAAPGTQLFEGQFRDAPNCGGGKFCGTGVLTGFGKIKTEIVFGPAIAAPAKGCLGATGTRTLTLANDATSTLRLAVKGAACGSRTWGTFKVIAGAGRFDKAKGSGVILGTLTKAGQESIRYTGVLTLTK